MAYDMSDNYNEHAPRASLLHEDQQMKETRRSFRFHALSGTVVCLLSAQAFAAPQSEAPATGEPQPSNRLEEIVVTAQRKAERLQDVPIAVNVVSGDSLAAKGLASADDLQAVIPGLDFVTTGGAGTPFLRGVGSNAGNPNDEPSVATYVDGVYISSSYANKMELNNLERVEVLKGPQGTLFGRNATGGVIQLVTRDPKHDFGAEASVGYGNYDTISGNVYLTGGLTDTLAVDFSAQGENQDKGWGHALARGGEDTYTSKNYSLRTKILFEPTDGLAFRLSGDYADIISNISEYRLPKGVVGIDGQLPPSGHYDTTSNITLYGQGEPNVIARQAGVSLRADYDMSFAHLVSISAYRNSGGTYNAEADGTPVVLVEAKLPFETDMYSEELQLLSPAGSSIDWVTGLFLYRNKAGYVDAVFNGAAFASTGGQFEIGAKQRTESVSGYAQGTVEVLPNTKLTLGARYTNEDQSFVGLKLFGNPFPEPADRGFEKWTWRAALDYAFTSDIHTYASYNRGVKGGGFDLLDPSSPGFAPEVLDAYEVGVKTTLLDNRLRLNASYFYYDYQNIQVQVVGATGAGIISTTNAAAATIKGLDVDFQFLPIDHLTFSGGFAWIKGEYDKFPGTVSYTASPLTPRPAYCSPANPQPAGTPCVIDASGNDTIRTPDFTGNLTAEYRVQSPMGEWPLSVTVSHNSGYFFNADNRFEQDAYTLLNAAIGWNSTDERYGVSLWGRNLTEEYYFAQGIPGGPGSMTVPAAPRTYGVTFQAKF